MNRPAASLLVVLIAVGCGAPDRTPVEPLGKIPTS
jgi:hypothetical protein